MRYKSTIPLFAVLFLLTGCNIINPPEKIPAYIYIQPFTYMPTPVDQSTSSKITEGWVYAGGELIGAFHLPALVPILAEGSVNISVFPGILDNGLSSFPNLYNFYETFETGMTLVPGQVDTIYPSTQYASFVQLAFRNDFEDGFLFDADLDNDGETKLNLTSEPDNVFEGDYSGIANLDAAHKVLHVTTSQYYDIPVNGTPVYFEMNYKSDVELTIGIEGRDNASGETGAVYPVRLFPKATWNKIYINFTEDIQDSDLDQYRVVLYALMPDSLQQAKLLFDNLKLVHQ